MKFRGRQRINEGPDNKGETVAQTVKVRVVFMLERNEREKSCYKKENKKQGCAS